jgi:hypothetical protein
LDALTRYFNKPIFCCTTLVRIWLFSDVPLRPINVSYCGHFGRQMLAASISLLDAKAEMAIEIPDRRPRRGQRRYGCTL